SHGETDPNVHGYDANQPDHTRSLLPDRKRVSQLENANRDARDGENVFESNQGFRGNQIKWGSGQCAPQTCAIPPAVAHRLGNTAKEIDKCQMDLQHTSPETK